MMLTKRYKSGFIHLSYRTGVETITVSVSHLAMPVRVKSEHAAKLTITQHLKDDAKRIKRLKERTK